jgi:hypothetical protein
MDDGELNVYKNVGLALPVQELLASRGIYRLNADRVKKDKRAVASDHRGDCVCVLAELPFEHGGELKVGETLRQLRIVTRIALDADQS